MYTHFTFNTYKNKHSLKESEFKEFLRKKFNDIAERNGFNILALNILADHVHVLIEHPFVEYSKIMKNIKGASARSFFIAYPSNRFVDRKLWGRSYYYRKIDESEIQKVISYIKEQMIDGNDKRYI